MHKFLSHISNSLYSILRIVPRPISITTWIFFLMRNNYTRFFCILFFRVLYIDQVGNNIFYLFLQPFLVLKVVLDWVKVTISTTADWRSVSMKYGPLSVAAVSLMTWLPLPVTHWAIMVSSYISYTYVYIYIHVRMYKLLLWRCPEIFGFLATNLFLP